MLGRRQLRAKAMQSIYAHYRSGDDVRKVEKNMMREIDEIQNLYYYLLNFLKALQAEAEKKIETGLQKNLPTEEEKNPNLKFVNNRVFQILNENNILNAFTEKHKEFTWDAEVYPSKVLKQLQSRDLYKDYMHSDKNSFAEDKKFMLKVFEKFVAPNEEISEFISDKNLHWADDLHIANTMVLNTLKNLKEDQPPTEPLLTLVKDEEHLEFTQDLYRKTIAHEKETTQIIDEKASNWELDRIALVDRIILQMALTELLYFPNIPPKVTINEYVEMAKAYSTPNSKIFVNGILDKTLKELKSNDKLNKYGAGLL